jgi:hypothetical protein
MQRDVIDRREIADLVNRLGLWLDEHRWDEAHEIFTVDATAETPGGIARGRDALVEQARRNHAEATTQHVITNVVVDLDHDRATVGANLVVTFAPRAKASEPFFQAGERYRFELVRSPDAWRISRVHVRALWRSGSPRPAV